MVKKSKPLIYARSGFRNYLKMTVILSVLSLSSGVFPDDDTFRNKSFVTFGPVFRFGGPKGAGAHVALELAYWQFKDKENTIIGADIGVDVANGFSAVYCDWQTMACSGMLLAAGSSIGPAVIFKRGESARFAVKASLWAKPAIGLIEIPTFFIGSGGGHPLFGFGFKFGRGLGKDQDMFIPSRFGVPLS
jgi:hypothetical protein